MRALVGATLRRGCRGLHISVSRNAQDANVRVFSPEGLPFGAGRSAPGPAAETSFSNAAEARRSPLAARLFELGGVERVTLRGATVEVRKADARPWDRLQPECVLALSRTLSGGARSAEAGGIAAGAGREGDAVGAGVVVPPPRAPPLPIPPSRVEEIVDALEEAFEETLQPMVAADGGYVHFTRFDAETGTVYVYLGGACVGCDSQQDTLQGTIKRYLQHILDEVADVRLEDGGEGAPGGGGGGGGGGPGGPGGASQPAG